MNKSLVDFLKGERFTKGKYRMGYILNECSSPGTDPWLVCTFSAVPEDNSPIKHRYSFQRVLSDVPCHRLYLQDSLDEAGCYYLCAGMDFGVADTVLELIEQQRLRLGVRKEHVVTVGSSKGGTCALYFGLRGHYGHVFAMGPQTRIAEYLLRDSHSVPKSMLRFMVGAYGESAYPVLDNVIYDILRERQGTTLHLLSSQNDNQYPVHIAPLLEQLEPDSPENDIEIDNRITTHSELAKFNPDYVRRKLFYLLFGVSARWEEDRVCVTAPEGNEGAVSCFFAEKPETVWQIPGQTEFPVEEDGVYTFTLVGKTESGESFVYSMPEQRISCRTERRKALLPGQGIDPGKPSELDALLAGAELITEADRITIRLRMKQPGGLRFAYHLMRDGAVLEKVPYTYLAEHTFAPLEAGVYSIKFYICTESDERKSYFVRNITI